MNDTGFVGGYDELPAFEGFSFVADDVGSIMERARFADQEEEVAMENARRVRKKKREEEEAE